MITMRLGTKAALLTLLAFVISAVASATAGAAMKARTIPAEKFRQVDVTEAAVMWAPFVSSAGASSATFWAPVRLPVGATVKKLELFTWGAGAPSSSVSLLRTKVNRSFYVPDLLMGVSDNTVNSPENPATASATTVPFSAASDLVVRKGYRYFVLVGAANGSSYINGCRVYFR